MPDSVTADRVTMPFDLAAALAEESWRQRPAWPVSLAQTRERMRRLTLAMESASLTLPEPLAAGAALAGLKLVSTLGAFAEAAACIAESRRRGWHWTGGPPEFSYLAGALPLDAAPTGQVGQRIAVAEPRWSGLRRAARAVTLNRPAHWLGALAAPRRVAVAHNRLLRENARAADGAVGFRHAAAILLDARGAALDADSAAAPDLAQTLLRLALAAIRPDPELADRLAALSMPVALAASREALADLAALKRLRALPKEIWCGTAGAYPSRAVALAVRERGGAVTVFDHGGASGMFALAEGLRFGDFRPATRFVTYSQKVAELLRRHVRPAEAANATLPEIQGWHGDGAMRGFAALPAPVGGARPRVVYAGIPFCGFRQFYPPILPDPVYLGFQLAVAAQLSALPLDLVCKPHPEGLLKGKPHPLEQVARTDYRRFEDVLPEADVAVFDDPHTTTFFEAICSPRRVVLIDLGINEFVPEAARLIRARCRIVPARYDEFGMPAVEAQALADAVLRAPQPGEAPEPILDLFAP